jgi:hemoglobin-like flavoprotein
MADATGLTGGQKGLLKESVNIMSKDLAAVGIALFAEVFNRYPQYQKKFRKIADMPVDDAMKTVRMKSHATLVIGALRTIVGSISDPDLTMDMLETLGVRHKLMGWLTKADFDNVFGVLLDILKDHEATKSTSDPAGTMEAWKALLSTIGTEVSKQL